MMRDRKKTVCIVSPFPPPYGGMAIQAQKLVELLKESGFKVIPVKTNVDFPDFIAFLARISGLRFCITLFLLLRNIHRALYKTDVVYFLTGFFNFFLLVTYPALLLIKMHKKRVVLSAHGGEAGRFFQKYRIFVKPILNRVDTVTTPSGFLKEAFHSELGIHTVVVPNISDLKQFAFRERNTLRPRLLVTRSLEEIYNVRCVINAFRIVYEHYPLACLGIVGGGSQRESLEKLVSDLGLNERVTFYGRVPNEMIQEIYNDHDIFINASRVDNVPLSILEAFACGLPVVSTNAGGIRYMIDNGVSGLLVENDDYEGLAEAVIRLLKDPSLGVTLSRNARRASKDYAWNHVSPILLPLLS